MTRTGHIVLKGSARMALPGGSGGTAELAFWGRSNRLRQEVIYRSAFS
jgi:hypothetical protein